MKPFITDKGAHVHLFPITITLGESALFKCVIYTENPRDCFQKIYTLEGTDYTNWGSDDNYIKNFICDKEPYIGRPVPDFDAIGNPILYVASPIVPDDNRSVHNENDVAKIETLQAQLEEQQKKLKTITDLLINKGMI